MEELGLDMPDVDPVLPEPDFFDAVENGGIIGSSGATISLQQGQGTNNPSVSSSSMCLDLHPPEIIFPNLGRSATGGGSSGELKYDDESCEFDEFFVGGLQIPKLLDNLGSESQPAPEAASKKEEGDSDEDGDKEKGADSTQDTEPEESAAKDEPEVAEEEEDRKSEGAKSSRPSTPDSRASSAVVRLSLPSIPKVALDSKKRISVPRESPEPERKESPQRAPPVSSPPRQTRGRLNVPAAQTPSKSSDVSSGGKRKMSDSEDDEEDEESSILNKSSTTRSGRQTRKIARFGFDKGKKSPQEELIGGGRGKGGRSGTGRNSDRARGRSSKRVERKEVVKQGREQLDSDSGSDLFTAIKFPKKTGQYNTGSNGWIFYTDRDEKRTILKPSVVLMERLTPDDVQRLQKEIVEAAARNTLLVEVCIDNFRSAEEAVKGGAGRIELCSSLLEGGLTPSSGFLRKVKERFPTIPVFAMIRPRGGDFVYSKDELDIMKSDIEQLKESGADGFVFGVLTREHEVNEPASEELAYLAFPSECTFHRAFDRVTDPIPALETIVRIGFARILTSGLKDTAKEGIPTLKRLVEAANNRILIMAGSGINEKNVAEIVKKTGVHEVHGSASKVVQMSSLMADQDQTPPSTSRGKSTRRGGSKTSLVAMGVTDDSVIKVTDSAIVAQIVKLAKR